MNSPEAIAKRNAALKGRKHSAETRQKLSQAQTQEAKEVFKARMNSPEVIAKRQASLNTMSDEGKAAKYQKISEAQKGRKREPLSEEAKEKKRAFMKAFWQKRKNEGYKGQSPSEETRKKLSESVKRTKAQKKLNKQQREGK